MMKIAQLANRVGRYITIIVRSHSGVYPYILQYPQYWQFVFIISSKSHQEISLNRRSPTNMNRSALRRTT